MEGNKAVELSWGKIEGTINHDYNFANKGSSKDIRIKNITYMVVATKDPTPRLDSICVFKKDFSNKFIIATFDANDKTEFTFG